MFDSKPHSFFEAFNSKTSFFLGLISGFLVFSAVGFFVLLGMTAAGSEKEANAPTADANDQTANQDEPVQQATDPKVSDVAKAGKDEHIRGDLKAPITIIEYSDFQCPYCNRVHPTLKKVLADYPGKVSWVYRHFPLTSIHPYAFKAAEASECAAEQGKFWEYGDRLYETQQSFSDSHFSKLAGELKLNQTKFDECLNSGKYKSKIEAQSAEASNAGIQGTPGIFVNEIFLGGAYPYENFKQIIDQKLQAK